MDRCVGLGVPAQVSGAIMSLELVALARKVLRIKLAGMSLVTALS